MQNSNDIFLHVDEHQKVVLEDAVVRSRTRLIDKRRAYSGHGIALMLYACQREMADRHVRFAEDLPSDISVPLQAHDASYLCEALFRAVDDHQTESEDAGLPASFRRFHRSVAGRAIGMLRNLVQQGAQTTVRSETEEAEMLALLSKIPGGAPTKQWLGAGTDTDFIRARNLFVHGGFRRPEPEAPPR